MLIARILSIACLLLTPLSYAQQNETDQTHTLVIVSTSDTHGQIDQFPRLATLMKDLRSRHKHVLLVDTGDRFTGNTFVDNRARPGRPMTELMNKLGYDVATIGAHDFDYGLGWLREHILKSPRTQYVVTNMVTTDTLLDGCVTPHHTVRLKDTPITVGFVGVTDLSAADRRKMGKLIWNKPNESDYKAVTDKFRLQKNTINVVLSHLGYETDRRLMLYTPNIDLILGGKTHVVIPDGLHKTGTLLVHAGAKLNYAGVTTIVFSDGDNPQVLSKSTQSIPLDDTIPEDPEIKKMALKFSSEPTYQQKIAHADEDIKPATLAHTFCKAIQKAAKADLVLYNRERIHSADGLKKGTVTLNHVYALEPYREYIVTCHMTKRDIEEMILSRFAADSSEARQMFDIYCCGFTYQIMAGETPTITSSLKDGVIYKVAMGDYMCYNYDFPQNSEGKPIKKSVRQALISYLREKRNLVNTPPPRPPIIRVSTISL